MKTKIHHHYAATIVKPNTGCDFFLVKYDATYPIEFLRGRANLLGGNASTEDISPQATLERNIRAKFSTKESGNAPLLDLVAHLGSVPICDTPIRKTSSGEGKKERIREAILTGLRPYEDYMLTVPCLNEEGYKPPMIFSCFLTTLDPIDFNLIREYHREHGTLLNIGESWIYRLNDLTEENPLTAWATGIAIGDFMKVSKPIPNPDHVLIEHLGPPRELYRAYTKEFDYDFPEGGFR
ncbi:MAG: hypothetical protein ABIH37_02200 [archaeon]